MAKLVKGLTEVNDEIREVLIIIPEDEKEKKLIDEFKQPRLNTYYISFYGITIAIIGKKVT